jgi:hypothetical protein
MVAVLLLKTLAFIDCIEIIATSTATISTVPTTIYVPATGNKIVSHTETVSGSAETTCDWKSPCKSLMDWAGTTTYVGNGTAYSFQTDFMSGETSNVFSHGGGVTHARSYTVWKFPQLPLDPAEE